MFENILSARGATLCCPEPVHTTGEAAQDAGMVKSGVELLLKSSGVTLALSTMEGVCCVIVMLRLQLQQQSFSFFFSRLFFSLLSLLIQPKAQMFLLLTFPIQIFLIEVRAVEIRL